MRQACNRALTVVATLTLAACATGGDVSPTPPPGQPAVVPSPAARPGTVWTYRDVNTYRLGNVMGTASWELGAQQINTLPGATGTLATMVWTPNWELVQSQMENLGVVSFNPPYPVLRFPLEVGKSWSLFTIATVTTSPSYSIQTYRVQVSAKVEGWERITTPAGEFDAIRVSIYANPDDAQPAYRTATRIQQYWWYAPAVNGFVRRTEKSEWTMVGGPDTYVQQGDRPEMNLTGFRPGP